jgi:hypothetical protein
MADKKISQLTALSAANLAPSTDVLAIVDTSATETKKIAAQDIVNGVLNVASAVGIGTASPGERLTVAATANNAGKFTSTATTTALVLDNTNANGWGSNLAILTGGTAAGYFGTIGSLLGNTTQDLAVYANTGNGFRVYTNGNNLRATFDSSGNLGIGTTSPGSFSGTVKLVVGSAAATTTAGAVTVYSGTATYGGLYFADGTVGDQLYRGAVEYNHSTDALLLYSAGAESARITSGGDFLFGVTAFANNKLCVAIRGETTGATDESIRCAVPSTSSTLQIGFYNSNGRVGSVSTDGSNTAFNTSSDRRLKENICLADEAGNVIDSIEVVKHDWKVGGHTRYGVIAQDLHKVAPEAVTPGDNGEKVERAWGVDYSKLVPMLVKEIQSLRARVAQLESK